MTLITRPQLITVTGTVNSAEGDKDPAEWMPSEGSFACTYVRTLITVKHFYDPSIDEAKLEALQEILGSCSNKVWTCDVQPLIQQFYFLLSIFLECETYSVPLFA